MNMRELLFRGKRRDNGGWIEGYLAAHDLICPSYPEDTLNATGEYCGQVPYVGFVEVDPETTGQFTRISDDHLKRIFEGDICRAKNMLHNGKEELFTVEWYENGFYLIDDTGTPWHPCLLEDIENIGNIYDLPELLGGA